MNIDRRSFVAGLAAAVGALATPAFAFATPPTIYGDGIHDDTAGLQAFFDGRRVRDLTAPGVLAREGNRATINGGSFLVRSRVEIRASEMRIDNTRFALVRPDGGITPVTIDDFTATGCNPARALITLGHFG